MKKIIKFLMLIVLVIFGITTDFNKPIDTRTIEEKMMETVVRVNSASGIVVYAEENRAIILTSFHVIEEDCKKVEKEIICNNGTMLVSISEQLISELGAVDTHEEFNVISVSVNTKHDIALLEIATNRKLEQSSIALDASDIRYGNDIWIASNPQQMFRSLKKGIVSSPLRFINKSPSFEISGGVIFGSSGGGIFNSNGELIGTLNSMRILGTPFCYSVFDEHMGYVRDECVHIPLTFIGFAVRLEIIQAFIKYSEFCEDFNYQCINDSMEKITDD